MLLVLMLKPDLLTGINCVILDLATIAEDRCLFVGGYSSSFVCLLWPEFLLRCCCFVRIKLREGVARKIE